MLVVVVVVAGSNSGRNTTRNLQALKIAPEVVLVQVALLDLLGHLTLTLSGLLGVLKLEAVLIHGETHGLPNTSD